jgi:hypothetical protein
MPNRRSTRTSPIYVRGDDEGEDADVLPAKQREDRRVEKRPESDVIIPETDDEADSIGDGATVNQEYQIVPPFELNRAPTFPAPFSSSSNVKRPASLSDDEDPVDISRNRGPLRRGVTIEGPPARLRG